MGMKHLRSDNLRFSNFAFLGPRRLAGWPGWALLLIGSITLAVAAQRWITLRNDLAFAQIRLENREALAPPERSTTPTITITPEMEARQRERQLIVNALHLDWQALFGTLERAQNADIALLSIQPDSRRGTLILSGEARNMAAVIGYQRRLNDGLRDVVLTTHEVQEQNPHKPVRFTITGFWGPGETP